MPLPYSDGTLTTWANHAAPEIDHPIDRDPGHIVVRQRMRGLVANYPAANVNGAVHATYANAYCIGDSSVADIGGGMGEVVRSYATVPSNTNVPLTTAYVFPGLDFGVNARIPLAIAVRARVQTDYWFNTDPTHASNGVPIVARSRFVWTFTNSDVQSIGPVYTTPNVSTYEGWIAAGTELVAQDSIIEQYAANIWRRVTPYVAAR